jgi:NAD(P)H-nitrite reductase large subunit
MNKNYVIIGNGPAGTTAAKKIRSLEPDCFVTVISAEDHPYYARPRLPEIISGKVSEQDIQLYADNWYLENNIKLLTGQSVNNIDKVSKEVVLVNEKIKYDKLLLAVGSDPNMPKISIQPNTSIYMLRTIEDALKIKEALAGKKEIIAIGGGLLGLELANSFIEEGRVIKVIEMFDHLLPLQLDHQKAKILQNKLEQRGFQFYLAKKCQQILSREDKYVVVTQDGTEIEGDLIVVSAGAKARLALATVLGLGTEKGILVDEYLQTNDPDIYAAGDCIQLGNKMWGFVRSSLAQGEIAAENMVMGNLKKYAASEIEAVLKVTGIDLKEL